MRYSSLRLIACSLAIIACDAVHAGTFSAVFDDFRRAREEGVTSHILDIDNDSLLLNKDDGFYTSGMKYTQEYTMRGAGQVTRFGWRIGQELYTASDIKLPPELVGPPNHPYAGWLFGGVYREAHHEDGTHFRIGLDVGCLGPCAGGEWTQTNLHRLLNQPLPRGWPKEVKNEIGVVLQGELTPARWRVGDHLDMAPSINGRFGNIFTDLGGGMTVRAGHLNNLPNRPALYAFMRADAHAVGYNATLQGGYFSGGNPHTVAPKRFVGEAEIGAVWADGAYGARIGLVRRSNEIRDLANSIGAQNYLRLQFSYKP